LASICSHDSYSQALTIHSADTPSIARRSALPRMWNVETLDSTDAASSNADGQPCHVNAVITSVSAMKPAHAAWRTAAAASNVTAEVAVRPALTKLSAAAVCAPSSRLFNAQIVPERPDWKRNAFSHRRTSALTLRARAQTPVAWINNSVGIATAATARRRHSRRGEGRGAAVKSRPA